MAFTIDEDAINEMVGDQNAPVQKQMQNLRNWCAEALRTTNEKGEPDAAIVYKQGNYNSAQLLKFAFTIEYDRWNLWVNPEYKVIGAGNK